MKASSQYKRSLKSLIELLKIFTDQFIIIPELTKAGNIHYHAIANFKRTMEYPKEQLIDCIKIHKIIGTVYINPLPIPAIEIQRTLDYMEKDYLKTYTIINRQLKINKINIISQNFHDFQEQTTMNYISNKTQIKEYSNPLNNYTTLNSLLDII
jgi:hypothetical protein